MSATASSTPAPEDRLDRELLLVASVVVLGTIMSILDVTVVNVAINTLAREFETELTTIQWVATGYTLALATVIPLTGWAADRFGTKRLYILALILFTAGSALCASASSIGMLIGFRILQGLGGGMLMPLGMTIMTKAAGPKRMGRLMAILGIPMLLGPICGPILGGWLIENASWHWIFLINVPIGVAAVVYALAALPKDAPHPSEKLDLVGVALMSPGLAAFLYGVSSIPGEGTFLSAKVLVPMILGAVLMVVFVLHTFRPEHPLLDLRLFRNRDLRAATTTMFLFGAAFFGGLLLVPTYFQLVRGESTLNAGLLVAPQGIGAMVTMPIAGALSDKLPVGRIVPFGLLLITAGMFSLTQIDASTSYTLLIGILFVMGLGMGLTMMPIMTSALRTLTSSEVARGSTLLNIVQQIASSVGVAIMSVLLTNNLKASPLAGPATATWRDPSLVDRIGGPAAVEKGLQDAAQAFASTYWVAGVLVALTFVPALMLPRKREETHLLDDVESGAPVVLH
jgi:EmrB/QacA subfamily drug resistance transporter